MPIRNYSTAEEVLNTEIDKVTYQLTLDSLPQEPHRCWHDKHMNKEATAAKMKAAHTLEALFVL